MCISSSEEASQHIFSQSKNRKKKRESKMEPLDANKLKSKLPIKRGIPTQLGKFLILDFFFTVE